MHRLRVLVTIAFAVVYVQAPWAHVHAPHAAPDGYEHQHSGLGPIHSHEFQPDDLASAWRSHDSDAEGSARLLGAVTAVPAAANHVSVVAPASRKIVAPKPGAIGTHAEPRPQAHGPPALSAVPPRAPPA